MENKPIVFFDGVCNLCSSAVQTIIKNDKKNVFLFASLQGETAKQKLTTFINRNPHLDSIILLEKEKIYTKSRAVLRIAKHLKFPFNLAYGFIIMPSFISNVVYTFIAKNRYKWFGKKEECWLPTPKIKAKFLP